VAACRGEVFQPSPVYPLRIVGGLALLLVAVKIDAGNRTNRAPFGPDAVTAHVTGLD